MKGMAIESIEINEDIECDITNDKDTEYEEDEGISESINRLLEDNENNCKINAYFKGNKVSA